MSALTLETIPKEFLGERVWIQRDRGVADSALRAFAKRHDLEIFESFDARSEWPTKSKGQLFVSNDSHPRVPCLGPVLVWGQAIDETTVEACERLLVAGRFADFEAALKKRGTRMASESFEYLLLKVRMLALLGEHQKAAELTVALGQLDLNNVQRMRWQIYLCNFDLIDRDVGQARALLAELRTRTDFFENHPVLYAELMHALCVCADVAQQAKRLIAAQEAESAYRRVGSMYGVFRAQQFQILCLASLGRVSEARSLYLSFESGVRSHGFIAPFASDLATQLVAVSLREGRLIDLDRLVEQMKPDTDPKAQSRALYYLRVLKLTQLSQSLNALLELQVTDQDKSDARQLISLLADFKVGRTEILQQTSSQGFLARRDTNVRVLLVSAFLEFSFLSDFLTDAKFLEGAFADLQSAERARYADVRAPYRFFEAAFWASKKNYARCLELLAECLTIFENGRQGLWAFRSALLESQVSMALGNLRQASVALQMARRWEQVYSTIGPYRTELIVTEAALLVRQGRESEVPAQWALDAAAHDVFEGRRALDADRDGFEYVSGWFFNRMRRWMAEWGLDGAGQMTCSTVGDELRFSREGFEAWARKFKGLLLNDDSHRLIYKGKVLPIGSDSVLFEIVSTFVRNPTLGLDKESIVLRCWKEHYNPLVHDARIYTAIRRIRSFTRDELIVNSGRLYRLNPKITWGHAFKSSSGNRAIERYRSVLDFVRANGSVTRQVIEQSLGLGTTQAKKEIQTMIEQGLLLRMNKGPATRYRLRF